MMSLKRPSSQSEPPSPPRWANQLLEWFVAPHLVEYIQGDLLELFHQRTQQVSLSQARREYVWAVLHCLTPFMSPINPIRNIPIQPIRP